MKFSRLLALLYLALVVTISIYAQENGYIVSINAQPGAYVRILELGYSSITPATFDLSSGNYTAELSLTGYESILHEFSVIDDDVNIEIPLLPLSGWEEIISFPANTTYFIEFSNGAMQIELISQSDLNETILRQAPLVSDFYSYNANERSLQVVSNYNRQVLTNEQIQRLNVANWNHLPGIITKVSPSGRYVVFPRLSVDVSNPSQAVELWLGSLNSYNVVNLSVDLSVPTFPVNSITESVLWSANELFLLMDKPDLGGLTLYSILDAGTSITVEPYDILGRVQEDYPDAFDVRLISANPSFSYLFLQTLVLGEQEILLLWDRENNTLTPVGNDFYSKSWIWINDNAARFIRGSTWFEISVPSLSLENSIQIPGLIPETIQSTYIAPDASFIAFVRTTNWSQLDLIRYQFQDE